MKDFNLSGKIFLFWRDVRRKYEKIKENPEKSGNDVSLGTTSLGMSICGAALAILFAYFAFRCFVGSDGSWVYSAASDATVGIGAVFALIGGIICVIIVVASFVYLNLASILYAYYQRKLNNRKIGKIAYITALLLCVGTLAAVVVITVTQFPALN